MTLRSVIGLELIRKDDKSDLVTDCHNILTRLWKNFSQVLNVNGVNDVWQTEIQTTEPLVPESSAFEFQIILK